MIPSEWKFVARISKVLLINLMSELFKFRSSLFSQNQCFPTGNSIHANLDFCPAITVLLHILQLKGRIDNHTGLYLSLWKTFDARSSMSAPVCLSVLVCARTDAVRLFAVFETFGSLRTPTAFFVTGGADFFGFMPILISPLITEPLQACQLRISGMRKSGPILAKFSIQSLKQMGNLPRLPEPHISHFREW